MTRRLMLEINGGTSVLMERSRRSRSVNIFVSPAGVRVAVPYWVSFAEAESIVRKRFGWIERNILRMEEFRRTYAPELLEMPTEKEAREKIENKLKCLAEEHGFSYNRLTIRRQKTRWGSCSHSNNISLNICLARLPADLMEYVILHELVHTRVKDHGRVFRRELDRLIGDSRGHEKRLKGYHLELLGSF
jgi:predicted metal-dependent hydrolase